MADEFLGRKTPVSRDQSEFSETRRKLLLTGSALAWGAAITSVPGCGGGGDESGAGQAPSTETTTTTSFNVTNMDSSGHLHTFTIACADLTGGGKTYIGGPPSGHSHSVMVSAEQLATISSGGTVTINTTDGHPHTWVITKPPDACT